MVAVSCHAIEIRLKFSTYHQQPLFGGKPQTMSKSTLDYLKNMTTLNRSKFKKDGVEGGVEPGLFGIRRIRFSDNYSSSLCNVFSV